MITTYYDVPSVIEVPSNCHIEIQRLTAWHVTCLTCFEKCTCGPNDTGSLCTVHAGKYDVGQAASSLPERGVSVEIG